MSRNINILYFFVISSFLVVSNAARLQGEGIIEGDVAEPGKFLYQVAIISGVKTICGGGIIDDQYILTAAHCVIGKKGEFLGKPLVIVAGTNDLENKETEGVSVSVHKIYVPSEYDHAKIDSPGDIAVLKLNKSLGLGENSKLKKLKLDEDSKETYFGKQAKIAGFGWDWIELESIPGTFRLKENGGTKNQKLKYLTTNIMDSADCQKIFMKSRHILESNICAKSNQSHQNPSGLCAGDSGGPLVYGDDTIIGVVSTSPFGCKESTFPAVYTKVSSYVDFIGKATNDVESESIRNFTF